MVPDTNTVPVVVISKRQDDTEAVNQALRSSGIIAQCSSLEDTKDLAEALREQRPLLMFVFDRDVNSQRLALSAQIRDKHLADLPILLVQPQVTEENMAIAMEVGANDILSLANKARIVAVAKREIQHCQLSRQLQEVEENAQQLTTQLESLVKESPDALIHVQEGIITAANPAWLEMFSYENPEKVVGMPALDFLGENSHTVFKGALVACSQGKWQDHTLDVKVLAQDGTHKAAKIQLERSVFDDEPCIRIFTVMDASRDLETPKKIVNSSAHHPLTGFYRRQRFLTEIESKLEAPSKGGIHAMGYIKLDNIHRVREQLGPISSDDLLLDFAKILQEKVRKSDLYGQFGGDLFMVLLPRGAKRDVEAWSENLREAINNHMFEIDDKSISISCTIGIAVFRSGKEDVADLVLRAQKAYQHGAKEGGNRISFAKDLSKAEQQYGDTTQVQQIKTALMQNNFRLVYQPVASLEQQHQTIFDALIRLVDEDGRETMPNSFLPTAERNGLMKNIDRWVIATAIRFCSQQTSNYLFVRLSCDSILDETLIEWITQQLTASKIDPIRMIFEVTEKDAENHLKEVKELSSQLKKFGCSFAIEHFGIGSHPLRLLEHIETDFVKIDGSLMEGIITDKVLQARVRKYVHTATEKNIATVAERVENANTMAVLWQIGFQFIQGFYVQGPEEVVLES